MELREHLLNNPKIPDALVDDVIERAQSLQDAESRAGEGATVSEIQAVAAELGIDPEHVQDALSQLRSEASESQEEDKRAAQLEAERVRNRRSRMQRYGGMAMAAVLALSVGTGALGMMGRSQVMDAQQDLRQAEAALVVQLDRQAALIPQLVALAGGESAALTQAQSAMRAAKAQGVDQRMAASQELSVAAAQALSGSTMDQDTRLNLQYELTGATNRITTEQRRYTEAQAQVQSVHQQLGAQVALRLGLVD